MKFLNLIKENYILTLILITATILRLYHLDYQSLWLDEIYTMNVSNPDLDFSTTLNEVKINGGFPYLYFILLKILFSIFGWSSIVARLFSAFFGVLVVFFSYKLGKELYNKKVGYYLAILFTFSEYSLYISQDARTYTFYLCAVILSFYFMIKFIKKPNLRNAIIYGLAAGFVLNTNYFSFINLFAQFVIVCFYLLLIAKEDKVSFIKKALISASIAILLFLPNIGLFLNVFGFKSLWIPSPTNDSFSLLFNEFLGNSEMTMFFITPLFIFYIVNLFKEKQTIKIDEIIENQNLFTFTIIFPWIFLFILTIFLKSYLDTPLIISRYFVSILPVFFIVLSIGFFQIKNQIIRYTILFCLTLFMFTNTTVVKNYYNVANKTQFREAANLVIDNNKNNEPVYTSFKYWFDFYLKNKFNIIEKPDLESVINEMMLDSTKIKPFWYTDAHGKPFRLSDKAQQFVDSKFYIDESFDGLDAWTRHFILEKDAVSKFDIKTYQPLKNQNGDLTKVWIEAFENDESSYNISGWGILENIDSKNNKISIVLINNLDSKVIKCQQFSRPDITKAENKNIDYNNSGFISNIQIEKLEIGNYKIGILIENKKDGKKGMFLTEKKIIIN
jgi:uncharacterized membrane protein